MDATLNTIDSAYGGTLTLSGQTGGTTVLTQAQANNKAFYITGSLTSNLILAFPPIGGGQKFIIPALTLNGFGLYVRGNSGSDQTGVYFLVAFAIPYGIVVTSSRVYWDYGACPVGSLGNFPMAFTHPGWIPCDGRLCNTTQQDLLFDLIGYSFGGSGVNFAVPDLRGYVMPCADNIGTGSAGRLFNWGINTNGGETTHVLAVNELASHIHGVGDPGHAHAVADPGHVHGMGGEFGYGIGGNFPSPFVQVGNTNTQAAATGIGIYPSATGVTVAAAGGNAGHNNVQLSHTVLTCIRW
jgi:microcystin-dependent protein